MSLSLALIAVLCFVGIAMLWLAVERARFLLRTASPAFVPVPMQVLDLELVPLNVEGLASAVAVDDRTAMVRVGYGYRVLGREFRSNRVFPLDLEWADPRIAPSALVADLGAGKIRTCFVNAANPQEAMLFRGWSPYLRAHVVSVGVSGVLVLCACAAFLIVLG